MTEKGFRLLAIHILLSLFFFVSILYITWQVYFKLSPEEINKINDILSGITDSFLGQFSLSWCLVLTALIISVAFLGYYSGLSACTGGYYILLPIAMVLVAVGMFFCGNAGIVLLILTLLVSGFIGMDKSSKAHAHLINRW